MSICFFAARYRVHGTGKKRRTLALEVSKISRAAVQRLGTRIAPRSKVGSPADERWHAGWPNKIDWPLVEDRNGARRKYS